MLRRILPLLCVLTLAAEAAHAQVKLEWKLREDSSSTVETTMKLEQNQKIAGQSQDTTNENRRTVKSTAGKRDGLGRLKVEEKTEEMYVKMTISGLEYEFDSKYPEAKGSSPLEAFRPVHKALMDQTMTMVHDKDNSLAEVEFDQQFLNSLEPAIQTLVKGQFDPEAMKKDAKQKAGQFPTTPVSQGDVWEHTETMNLGSGQIMTFNSKYKYEGTVEKEGKTLDKITYEVVSVSIGLDGSPSSFQIKSSDLKPEKSSGVIYFDRELGNIVESTESCHITGTITLEVNNNSLPAEINLKIESKVIRK